jgi:hypothetical protein
LLAAHRNPESYVAESTPLNREGPRFSEDIDIFHDREERVARAAEEDAAALQAEGLDIVWQRREPAIFFCFFCSLLTDDLEVSND